MPQEDKKLFERIVIHCSYSEWGCNMIIQQWHKERGFRTTGYHEVVTNGYPTASWWNNGHKVDHLVGSVEIGREINDDRYFDISEMGAHVGGHNTGSYGICMIGSKSFSNEVLNKTLDVVKFRLNQFNLKPSEDTVKGHYELDSAKTCPNIDMNVFRNHLINKTYYGQKIKKEFVRPRKNSGSVAIFTKILNHFFSRGE